MGYGFRKQRDTRDSLALLTTDISPSPFEMQKQTVAAFLDINGAYDNVLIYVTGNCPIYVLFLC
jgi:hypothetical protein